MKRNINIFLVSILIAFASCSFTSKSFDNPDKDKLLMQLITYLLEQGHFEPKDINDDFSESLYVSFLNQIDPFKNYFYQSDLKDFEQFKTDLDDQILDHDLSFFNLVYERLQLRIEDSKSIYSKVLERPFDYDLDEEFNTDYEMKPAANSKSEMKDNWRKQLKFSTLSTYHNLVVEQEELKEKDPEYIKKSDEVLEIEAPPRFPTEKEILVLENVLQDCPIDTTQKIQDRMLDERIMSYAEMPMKKFVSTLEWARTQMKKKSEAE